MDVKRFRLKDPSFHFVKISRHRSCSIPGAVTTCAQGRPPRAGAWAGLVGSQGKPLFAGVRAGQPEQPQRPPPSLSPAPSAPEGWLAKSLLLPALCLTSSGSWCSGDKSKRPAPTERTTPPATYHHRCPPSLPLEIASGFRARTVSATPDRGAEGEEGCCPECPLPLDPLDLREGLAPQVSPPPPPPGHFQCPFPPSSDS